MLSRQLLTRCLLALLLVLMSGCGGASSTDTALDGTGDTPIAVPDSTTPPPPPVGSCEGNCAQIGVAGGCSCHPSCKSTGDCCDDYVVQCEGCQTDADCVAEKPCVTGTCVGGACKHVAQSDCCTVDSDCVATDPCMTGRCDGPLGQCVNEPSLEVCWAGDVCVPVGDAHPDELCKICESKEDGAAFILLEDESVCDDDNVCTDSDTCNEYGQCLGVLVSDCCASDVFCNTIEPCTIAYCDPETHTCMVKPADACCEEGACCDTSSGAVMTAGKQCGFQVIATGYDCKDNAIEQRFAYEGCDGKSADGCSSAPEHWLWDAWVTIEACPADTNCVLGDPTTKPTCEGGTPPLPTDCTVDSQCDDGLACSLDHCAIGTCKYSPTQAGLPCGAQALGTVYKCSSNGPGGDVLSRDKVAVCDGLSMECTGALKVWGPWSVWKECLPSQVCSVTSENEPGQCVGATDCNPAAPCCDANGTFTPKGTQCPQNKVSAKYQCTSPALGGAVQQKQGYAGCTGFQEACSGLSIYVVYDDWQTVKQCKSYEVCEDSWSETLPGECTSDCKPGSTCCGADGKNAPAGTPCGSATVSTEYQCVNSSNKSEIHKRTAVKGCPGYSTTCSTSSLYYTWSDWGNHETCESFEVCEESWSSSQPGTCEVKGDCVPNSECCSASGSYLKKGTQCSDDLEKTEYKCSSTTQKGGQVMAREAYPGCNGIDHCSTISYYYYWTDWAVHEQCADNAKCDTNVSSSKPGTCETDCEAGTECCDASGDYAGKGTKCGTQSYKTEYKCSTETIKGGTIMTREGWKGCSSNTSIYCSTSTTYMVWDDWQDEETCPSYKFCDEGYLTTSVAKCITECSPNTTCCSKLGEFEPQGTKCSTWVYDEKYKCSDTKPGGAVMVQNAYKGCEGDDNYCSSLSNNLHWTGVWEVYEQCKSDEKCKKYSTESYADKCVSL